MPKMLSSIVQVIILLGYLVQEATKSLTVAFIVIIHEKPHILDNYGCNKSCDGYGQSNGKVT